MNPAPHPRSAPLAAAIGQCQGLAWSGKFIRCAGAQYANRQDLVTGEGSSRFGGRYNPVGVRAVYGSLDLDTAVAEIMALSRRQNHPDPEADVIPFTVVSVEVDLRRLLDLTDPKVRRTLKVSVTALTDEPWQDLQNQGREALTQAIGRLAREAGFDGLLFPSAAHRRGGRNLVTFPDRRAAGGLRIVRKEKLPARRRRK